MLKAVNTRLAAAMITSSLLSPPTLAEEAALVAAGKRLFTHRCSACHSMTPEAPSMFGPHLAGIVGRQAGTAEDFEYTMDALREQAFAWDETQLDAWLERPDEIVPDMCLTFRGLARPEDRKALITYMKQASP